MKEAQVVAEIEESLRRAAEAIRRGDPDALAGRMSPPARGKSRPTPENAKAEVKKNNEALG